MTKKIEFHAENRIFFNMENNTIRNKHDIHLKEPIKMNVDEKYGTTVRVLLSNSWSKVRDANLAIRICLNMPLSSAYPTTRKNSSSHAPPLQFVMDRIMIIHKQTKNQNVANHVFK